jgi:hypothetical protein
MKRWLARVLFVAIAAVLSSAHVAGASDCQTAFRRLHDESLRPGNPCSIYEPARCGHNVLRLAQKLEEAGVDVTSAHAIVFVAEHRKTSMGIPALMRITPDPARTRGGVDLWEVHVVLENEGRVWDFDSDLSGQAPREFFSGLFPERADFADRPAHTYVRRIPLGEYRRIMAEPANRWNNPMKKLMSHYDDVPSAPLKAFDEVFPK